MGILERLKSANEFPILFIGSGMSLRYLDNFPDWMTLLESFWKECGFEEDFYGMYNNKRHELKKSNLILSDTETDFKMNTQIGTIIHEKYNQLFNLGKINIEGFTTKDAHKTQTSPFKIALSNRFDNYRLKKSKSAEIKSFIDVIGKSSIVITTNYDQFIEKEFKNQNGDSLDIYVGQSGFFRPTEGAAELFKIHGSIEKPSSIVIDEQDYKNFNKNSVLITAKIISLMIHSPIIFLGYSLKDVNVRNFIKDFARSIDKTDSINLEERLIIVEREEGQHDLKESTIDDRELGCRFTSIKTDNFQKIYDHILSINQGVSPLEVRKYKKTIRSLIEESGKKNQLKSVLVSSTELDDIQHMIKNNDFKNIAIAIGDSRVIFQIPDNVTYMHSYMTDDETLVTNVALRFLFGQRINTYIPFKKFITKEILETAQINNEMKNKLESRAQKYKKSTTVLKSIIPSNQIKMNNMQEIIDEFYGYYPEKCYDVLCFNIERLDLNKLKLFIITELENLLAAQKSTVPTQLRKLILVYDIKINS